MKLVERTYRVDAQDVPDLAIDVNINNQVGGFTFKFTSAWCFVQWVFGHGNANSWYEFLVSEDLRHEPHHTVVTAAIKWCEGSSCQTLGCDNFKTDGTKSFTSNYMEEHWEKAWEDAVVSAKARIALGYLKGVKIVEDASDNA